MTRNAFGRLALAVAVAAATLAFPARAGGPSAAGVPPPTVGGVWTWTDAAGRVYFGDTPPSEPGLRAAPFDVSPSVRDPAAQDAARARAEAERARLEALRAGARDDAEVERAAGTRRAATAATAAARVGDGPTPASCQARWQRYHASAACFARFRVVGGGVKPEAFRHCAEVPMPERCD